jgi:hypothetical protein
VHNEFLLLRGCRDTFLNTKLTNEFIVLMTFANVAGVFDAHTQLYMTFLIGETFRQNPHAIFAVILMTVGAGHVLVEIGSFAFQTLHQETLAGFLVSKRHLISVTRQQSNVSSICVIRATSLAPDGFEIGPMARRASICKEGFLFLGQVLYLPVNGLVFLKRSCQVLGMRQLALLELGIDHLAAFLVIRGGIRFANRGHDKIHSPCQLAAHTMRVRDLAA